MVDKVHKSDAEWKAQLTSEQFRVTRKKGTERAFSGELWDNHRAGTYRCVCCGTPLFASDAKFESGTGWPSFVAPVARENVREEADNTFWMKPHRGRVRGVRRAPGPRVSGRARADRHAVLHELRGAQVRSRRQIAAPAAGSDEGPLRRAFVHSSRENAAANSLN